MIALWSNAEVHDSKRDWGDIEPSIGAIGASNNQGKRLRDG
jgi:hypothetical protein